MTALLLGAVLLGLGGTDGEIAASPPPTPQPHPEQAPDTLAPADGPLAGRVTVVYWPGDASRAREVLRVLEERPHLPALPEGVPSRARIAIAPDRATFDSLAGGEVPEWGVGVAIPDREEIVLSFRGFAGADRWSRAELVLHEWAHLGLHEFLDGLRAPRWFDEGYAQWASGGWSVREAWRLRLALAGRDAPALGDLSLAWPRDRASAEVAYMLSATGLEYLTRHGGEEGLRLFLERWREEGSFEAALRRTYGVTSSQLEDGWRDHVTSRYGWLLVMSQSIVFWGILAGLLVVLFAVRRRRDRERLAELRATEPPDEPAWWREET